MRVLVVEDYEPVRSAVVQAQTEEGYAVDSAANGRDGLWYAKSGEHDVIVLDILLPHVNGIEILQALRSSNSHVPVLLLTALDEVDQRIKGLDEGADDYLVKPFAIAELIARLRALLRRSFGDGTSVIEIGALRIDTSARLVFCNDTAVEFTAREYGLLELLARRRGKVVARAEIWKSPCTTLSPTRPATSSMFILGTYDNRTLTNFLRSEHLGFSSHAVKSCSGV